MSNEINVYYFEHNCIFIRISLLQNFSFHFNALLNPSGHTVYKIMYKFETRTVPIWRHFSHNFFDILLTFLIDLILDTFSNILNRIQVRTIARPFQYGHIFTPEPLFVRFAACFLVFSPN